MSASSACWRSRVSRSTRGSESWGDSGCVGEEESLGWLRASVRHPAVAPCHRLVSEATTSAVVTTSLASKPKLPSVAS